MDRLMCSKWWAMPAVLAIPLLAVTVTASPSAAQEATPAQTLTFNYTGGPQSWTVPADVHQATFDVYGSQGGRNGPLFPGGQGGRATATIPVTLGEVLAIMVGGQGLETTPPTVECVLVPGGGGFNGGGNGGNLASECAGAGGGGASDVRRGGSALADRILIAGGGGGGAGNLICNQAGGGGGLTGGSATQNALCSGGGVGGNQNGTTGSGQLGQGGVGADDDGFSGPGGGGGGGYYGGSGGNAGLGGGGGSGFGPAGTVFQTGVRQGAGVITIAFGSAPTVTAVSPTSGPARGSFDTVIIGTNFVPGQTAVTFGGVPSPQVSCGSTTQCNAVSPPGSGSVGIRVTANGQQSFDTPADDYTYLGAPTITSISPTAGPEGTVITIEGTNFFPSDWPTWVIFGSNNNVVETRCTSFTLCTVVSPPGVGTVALAVGTQSGESNSVPFTMQPSVTSITPTGGPAAGNTAVTVTGTGFSTASNGTVVHFGSVAALAVGCGSATTCTAVSPPGSGTVSVRVTVNGVQSPDTAADDFRYADAEPPPDPSADLAALEGAVQGAGRVGPTLARLAARARMALEDGRTNTACAVMRGFLSLVRSRAAVGQLTEVQAVQFSTHAMRVRSTLDCR